MRDTIHVMDLADGHRAAISVADPSKAYERRVWRTQRGLEDICRDG